MSDAAHLHRTAPSPLQRKAVPAAGGLPGLAPVASSRGQTLRGSSKRLRPQKPALTSQR